MTQLSWPWDTVAGLGDGSSQLGEDNARAFLATLFGVQDPQAEGVSKGVLNELEVTGVASPLQIDTGSAICYGLYFNDAPTTVAVATPALGTTGGRVVLRTNWAGSGGPALEARTRVTVTSSPDGDPSIPALDQTKGTRWEISLATFTITTGGVIALTDDRTFRKSTAQVDTDEIIDAAITLTKLSAAVAAQLVTNGDSHDHAGGDGAQIPTAGVQNDAIDDTKIGDNVAQFYRRQGGSASNWQTPGVITRTPGATRKQAGSATVTITAAPAGILNIVFPVAFSDVPLITGLTHALFTTHLDISYSSVTATGFRINLDVTSGASVTGNIDVNWEATGPE